MRAGVGQRDHAASASDLAVVSPAGVAQPWWEPDRPFRPLPSCTAAGLTPLPRVTRDGGTDIATHLLIKQTRQPHVGRASARPRGVSTRHGSATFPGPHQRALAAPAVLAGGLTSLSRLFRVVLLAFSLSAAGARLSPRLCECCCNSVCFVSPRWVGTAADAAGQERSRCSIPVVPIAFRAGHHSPTHRSRQGVAADLPAQVHLAQHELIWHGTSSMWTVLNIL
jgi:hypothetical protein